MAPVLICVMLLLFVDVSPGGTLEVELSPGEELFQLGSKVQFNCTVKNASESSFDVTWYFKKCNKLPDDECEGNHFQQINIKKSYRRGNIFITEHLVEGPGILRCGVNSSNVDERINATHKLFVTDIKNSTKVLNVWGRPSEITAGDSFTLTCANNVFLGSGQPTWMRTEREMPKNGTWVYYTEIEVEGNSEGLRVEANSSTYTHYTNLTFMNISRQHEGLYTCDGGDYSEKVLIFVKDPEQPKITYTNLTTLEQKVVEPQSNLTIFCRTQGLPKPKVHWYKDGEPLVTNETVTLKEANHVLEIQSVQVTHRGVYVCVANNSLGEVNATGKLSTIDFFLKPIIKGSTSKIIREGNDLELQCVAYAENGKQFNITWIVPEKLKNSSLSHKTCQQNISLSCSTALLKIYNAKVNYTGEYTCVVRDNKPLNNDSVVVTVLGKDETSIILSNSPQNWVLEYHENLTIEVNITASMPVELEWYRPGGIVLRPGETDDNSLTNFSLSHNPDVATLTVTFLNGADAGQYSLHAHHAFNSTWYNITVTVLDSPDITVNGYDEKLFTLGLKVNLTCSVESFTPVDISWQFLECDVKELFDSIDWDEIGWPESWHDSCDVNTEDACSASRGCHEIISKYYDIFQETYEVIGEFHVQREGVLICAANNSEGRYFQARNVYISEFSNMSTPLQIWGAPTEVVMEDTFNLTCVASSYLHKSLTWYWYYGDQEIKLQSNMSGLLVVSAESNYTRFSHLQFVNISKQQEGMYICKEESNEWSAAFEFVHVQDSAAPQITETNLNETGMKMEYGRNFTISCYSQGMPKPVTLWFKNNESLTIDTEMELGDRNQTLSIKHVERKHEGKYCCKVENRLGSVEKEGKLTTDAVAPEINETNLNTTKKLERYVGTEINIYCISQGNPKPKTLWFKDGSPIVTNATVKLTSSNSTLELHDLKMTQRGKYRCEVRNDVDTTGTYAEGILIVTDKPPSISTGGIVSIVVVCGIALLLFILLGLKIRKQKKLEDELQLAELEKFERGMPESINPDLTLQEQADLLPYKQTWEFPRDKLKLGRQLGAGAFGMVLKAEAWGISDNEEVTTVAVKMTKGVANATFLKALSSELKILMYIGQHLNIVNFLGACTKNIGKLELYMIVEYCHFGNLHKYLMTHREDFVNQVDSETGQINPKLGVETLRPLENFTADEPKWRLKYRKSYKVTVAPVCTQVLVYWAFQVSKGLEYLASLKVVHGDLAARNVLLADNNVVKICDFGLSNRLYASYYTRQKAEYDLPVKWMAPESISDRVFSIESDVWSFGIFVWELFSLARSPYPDMEADARLYLKLCDGYRMGQPRFAPDKIYDVMWKCWQIVPRKRPTFTELAKQLGALLDDTLKEHYMELKVPYEKANRQDSRREFFNDLINSSGHNGAECSLPGNEAETPTYLDLIGALDSTPQTPCSDDINNTSQSPCSDEINNTPQSPCNDEINNTPQSPCSDKINNTPQSPCSDEVNDVQSQKSSYQVGQDDMETCMTPL